MNNDFSRAAELATRITDTARNTLLIKLRFMDTAIFRLFAKPEDTTLAVDGKNIYYGIEHILKLFKNIPLIEPLEYKEEKRIRDFVVAIDTSGSTSGETVQKFLNKTYNILKNSESYFSKVNI